MGMERKKFTVYGRVQRVGYRDRVAEIARKLGVRGFAHNLDDEVSVEIVAEGEKGQLDKFAQQINIFDPPVEVERIEESKETATGEFGHFKIMRGEPNEELGERVDVASSLLYGMNKKQDVMIEKQDIMIGKQDIMIEKQDLMIGKQGETIGKLDEFHKDTTGRFDIVDNKYGKISDKLEKMSVSLDTKLDNISASLGKLDKISVSLDKLVVIIENFGK